MDVESYLRQVKLENDSLPDVVVAETVDSRNGHSNGLCSGLEDSKSTKQFSRLLHIDEEYQRLDSGFKLSLEELKYFRLLKANLASVFGIQNSRADSAMWNYALRVSQQPEPPAEERDCVWAALLESEPPAVEELCRGGLNYGCTQECLHVLGNLICQFPGSPLSKVRAEWLYILLLMLDELHAMSEFVSYELQRIRRSLLRRCAAVESLRAPEFAEELSHLRLLSSLISSHFNQH